MLEKMSNNIIHYTSFLHRSYHFFYFPHITCNVTNHQLKAFLRLIITMDTFKTMAKKLSRCHIHQRYRHYSCLSGHTETLVSSQLLTRNFVETCCSVLDLHQSNSGRHKLNIKPANTATNFAVNFFDFVFSQHFFLPEIKHSTLICCFVFYFFFLDSGLLCAPSCR